MNLTKTEYKIAGLVAEGFSEKEIAAKLFVSYKTIHNHTYNMRKKLNARSAVDIARVFILNLDNPKRYFSAVLFLAIQFFIMSNTFNIDMRRVPTQRIARTTKTVGRKQPNTI